MRLSTFNRSSETRFPTKVVHDRISGFWVRKEEVGSDHLSGKVVDHSEAKTVSQCEIQRRRDSYLHKSV